MTRLKSLCLFCGSRDGAKPAYKEAAHALADVMVDDEIRLVFGGGGIGLMGAVAKRVMARGGEAIGVIPDFLQPHEGFDDLTRVIVTRTMHERKQIMFDLAEAFVVLPGGIGTLDETIEMMTWRQLERHAKPIALLNVNGYFDPLLATLDHLVTEGFAEESMHDHLIIETDPLTMIEKIDAAMGENHHTVPTEQ